MAGRRPGAGDARLVEASRAGRPVCAHRRRPPGLAKPLDVTLYTRPGCHLCEEAKAQIGPLLRRAGARLREVNIDADPALRALYDYDVPVILLGARKVAKHRVDLEQFRKQLEEAAPSQRRHALGRRLVFGESSAFDADAFVRHGARTPADAVVRGDLARGAQRLVVIGRHANRVAQLFVELAQIAELRWPGRESSAGRR